MGRKTGRVKIWYPRCCCLPAGIEKQETRIEKEEAMLAGFVTIEQGSGGIQEREWGVQVGGARMDPLLPR